MSYPDPDLLLPASPDLLDTLNVPPELSHWLGAILHTIQAAGGTATVIPAGTVVLPPELPPIPSTADEIDRAIAAL